MNKYLEKIASTYELEDGVRYDAAKHELKISPKYMNAHLQKEDHKSRLVTGVMGSAYGGLGGFAFTNRALDRSKYNRLNELYSSSLNNTKVPPRGFLLKTVDKLGRKPVVAAGSALGALGIGALGYAIGGITSMEKPRLKDAETIRLERKYDDRINEIEGW